MDRYNLNFYKGKKVFVTGHTGFKGTWLCKILVNAGAIVTGYALKPETTPNLYDISGIEGKITSIIGDIRDYNLLSKIFKETNPEIVFHLAAQPLVLKSYLEPRDTYEINVMGTTNILECIRHTKSVQSFLNVTTDKVYKNKEWCWGYRENEELNGHDPYSNSKSCSELVTNSYKNAFFNDAEIAISTARAGNVLGGGDFAENRIIPDCVRAIQMKKDIEVRNPNSIRPYQHVLEPVCAYLMIAYKQYLDKKIAGSYNVGPELEQCVNTVEVVSVFCETWQKTTGVKPKWSKRNVEGPHEANYLKLDCSKIKTYVGWQPKWNIDITIEKVVEWTVEYLNSKDVSEIMDKQIEEYLFDII